MRVATPLSETSGSGTVEVESIRFHPHLYVIHETNQSISATFPQLCNIGALALVQRFGLIAALGCFPLQRHVSCLESNFRKDMLERRTHLPQIRFDGSVLVLAGAPAVLPAMSEATQGRAMVSCEDAARTPKVREYRSDISPRATPSKE